VDLTPWRWARPIALGISLLVLVVYVALAGFFGVLRV
jgi:hypothetical protein